MVKLGYVTQVGIFQLNEKVVIQVPLKQSTYCQNIYLEFKDIWDWQAASYQGGNLLLT